MKIIVFLFFLFLSFNNYLFCVLGHDDLKEFLSLKNKNFTIIDFSSRQNSTWITTLINNNKEKFIVKQKNNIILASVIEKLAAEIAHSIDILVNRITAIPCHCSFIGKRKKSLPATFHTFVPGISIKSLPKPERRILGSLRQAVKKSNGKRVFGLTKELVGLMTLHEDMPKIVALDTFIANHDRHRGNYFYDEKSDRFSFFDFEAGFRRNLAEKVYGSLCAMTRDKNVIFSPEEMKSLALYRDTLKRLVKQHTPDIVKERFNELVDVFGIDITKKKEQFGKKLYSKMIVANYNSCIKIVDFLDNFLKR